MISLTREDWCEIYNALETKSQALRHGRYSSEDKPGQDTEWLAHLETLKQTIGPDGAAAAHRGVERSK